MPKGIPKKKRAAKKANKQANGKRKYTKRAKVEVAPSEQSSIPTIKKRTVKEEILDTLNKFHVEYTDKDGHIAIRGTQMVDHFTIKELIANGVQIMNARKDDTGAYIALYY